MPETCIGKDRYGKYIRCDKQIVRPVPIAAIYFVRNGLYLQEGGSEFEVKQAVRVEKCATSPHFRVCGLKEPGDEITEQLEIWSSHGYYYGASMGSKKGTTHESWMCWRPSLLRKVDVPPCVRGKFTIERFDVDEVGASLHNMRDPRRLIFPGRYTRLFSGDLRTFDGVLLTSDTLAEVQDHYAMTQANVRGNVCINGLGLGVALQAVLDNPKVKQVTVLEIEEDIMAMVAPHYKKRYGEKLTVMRADAFEWEPSRTRFDFVWHDIWSDISDVNYESMKQLHYRWGQWTAHQASWCHCEMRRAALSVI